MSCILFDISGYFELSGSELLRVNSITTSKKHSMQHCFLMNNILLYFDNSSANISKLLLLKVKMRHTFISQIGRHFQTFSVAGEGFGDIMCLPAVIYYLIYKSPFWKKNCIHGSIS